jgi:hypothetical protein
MSQGMLSRAEVLNYLGCDSKALDRLIQKKRLTLYKIGGEYERFDKEEVIRIRLKTPVKATGPHRSLKEKVFDFWHYNNFYIVTFFVLAALTYYFFRK